ncbi:hypothetical protein [Mycolicibacterium confluentis]|uniref:Uncharacterized protein n=1 Tax=Mycolicibacterium confluentis TaxID=28047 RepID=A0A7I7XWS3_9MYCO|nr:hypothetical protein [Mycolicibacterium confluentis]MCV7321783.1 hypothetical protein [Mycolicibacterium confluentis]ORV32052.1 oxidoreductase [Mycolicibacterium confluentis]BBZ33594.1 hypothetical protein MCNF_21990 [Mycolicibacterium confluentis]
MSDSPANDRIDDVAPGDIIVISRAADRSALKVVHKEATDSGYLITLEEDGGATFQLDLAAGTLVERSLESKWESEQSPTPHVED